ncbi:uncharacterized protein EDB91DRAFT_1088511 [Suillus paluster]|uniref:uncharacterized protein n=1 Tax=Suillus paluster TaxID=48578 RepID=UPI001B85C476|nr:uncharacterized protein EDB91DRAFT_1088511 [Suillus paluster]KAG1721244.1 hypothetical protein EDB91DRAFT_1088511 [Suillus paluster]
MPLINPGQWYIIICPFVILLEEFLASPRGHSFIKVFHDEHHDFLPKEALIYHTCMDQPEIGFHILNILSHYFNASLKSLICGLQLKMIGSDCMLVFFNLNREVDGCKVEYGLLVVKQMSGCSGRDGSEAHTFYLTQKTSLSMFQSNQDHHYIKGLDDACLAITAHKVRALTLW